MPRPPGFNDFFHSLDRIREETRMEELRRNFEQLDKDKDNLLSMSEWMEAMRLSGYDMSDQELERMFSKMDKNKDGMIDFDEFSGKETKVEKAFKVLDKNGDGVITKAEYKKVCPNLDEDKIEALFVKFNISGDGKLTYEEFCGIMNSRKKREKK